MSYNIDHIDILSGSLRCDRDKVEALCEELDGAPEYLDDYLDHPRDYVNPDGTLRWVPWAGSWSGRSSDHLPRFLVECCTGNASLRLVWEGGDSIEHLVVEDGKVYAAAEIVTLTKGRQQWPKAGA